MACLIIVYQVFRLSRCASVAATGAANAAKSGFGNHFGLAKWHQTDARPGAMSPSAVAFKSRVFASVD
jgi:hypothetical protein